MDRELYNKVSVWFEEHREQMKEDIMRLVRIPSISAPCEESGLSEAFPHQEAPFGHACRACLEEMLAIGREHGFHTESYGNRVGSIGEEKKDWENMIGFWNHMDVVPVGNQWVYEPFEPMVEEPFLIGRGAQDNKGPAVGILYMMECLRELKVPIKHQLCLFVGTDEERGMEDLEYYTRYYPTPLLSMVADSGFPVCYGEKGIVEGRMYSREPVSGMILELVGGSASNMIPDEAYAVLVRTQRMERAVEATIHKMAKGLKSRKGGSEKQEKPECLIYPEITMKMSETEIRVIAKGKSGHSAFPEGSMNAIHSLLCFLAELDTLSYEDRVLFDRLAFLSEEYYGEHLEIACGDEVSGRTTCAATVLGMENGRIFLHFNIRYAITINQEELLKGLKRAGEKNELIWMLERNSKPNYFPKEHMAVSRLTALYNEITGSRKESFVMGGGTYARKLPRAFAYGVGGMEESEEDKKVRKKLFLPGHGGAHEPDEGLNLRLLADAMKIYAMAMVELNHCEL